MTTDELSRPWLRHYASDTPRDVPLFETPLYSLLDRAAEQYPRRRAVVFQNTRITYAALREQAERFAGALRRAGVTPGERVAVMLPNLPQTAVAFWGILKAGAIAVMVNPLYMETELCTNLNDAGAETLIVLDALWPRIAPLRSRLPVRRCIVTSVDEALSFPLNWLYRFKQSRQGGSPVARGDGILRWKELLENAPRLSEPVPHPITTPALLQYTGGTTGTPKGVILTHADLGTNARQILAIVNETAATEHSFIALLPFFHVYGLATGIIIPAALAATTLPLPRYVPQDVLRLIDRHRPSIFPGAPAVYASLLQQKSLTDHDLSCIRLCISGSAPLPPDIFRRFQELTGAVILEGYGLTEASPITHINPRDPRRQKTGSIGLPLPGTDARIVDADKGGAPLPPGREGELIVRGPQVMRGYWRKPEDTAATLRDGWLYTGDIAVMDEDGYFFIRDRKKDLVLVGGYNVYPREVEETLREYPGVQEAVCIGIREGLRGESLKAYVTPKPGVTLRRADIIAWCRRKLASYKVPRLVEFRDDLPRSSVGKVLRRALREEEERRRATRGDGDA